MWLIIALVFIYLILSPLIALIKSSSAHDQIELLQKKIKKISDELAQLKRQVEKETAVLSGNNRAADTESVFSSAATTADTNQSAFLPELSSDLAAVAKPALQPSAGSLPSPELPSPNSAINPAPLNLGRQEASYKQIDDVPRSSFGIIKDWLTGGNLVAKLGLFILLIGVGFLTKYAAARVSVPIETRLALIAVGAIILLAWGCRIVEKRRQIAMSAQGCAIAILMLVIFAAYRLYELIPADVAFILLFLLTFFTCLLAHFQNALWLAIFGITGGFMVPVLVSKGQGNHIALFGYYSLLSTGVLALSWKHSWRLLNLLSFCFTAGVGILWGYTNYVSSQYLSSQIFLILLTVLYISISVLYAFRESQNSSRYVDASLVFGVPTVAFGLQYGLMNEIEFGLAFSALIMSAIYLALTIILWHRQGARLRFLNDSFLALSIVFVTLAVPLAVDGRWTSAAWALEGAALLWVGLRQQQKITWVFGMFIQFGAWLTFIGTNIGLEHASARDANLWLGFLVLGMSAYLAAISFKAGSKESSTAINAYSLIFLYAAALWLLFGMWVEAFLHTSGASSMSLITTAGLAVAAFSIWVAARHEWPHARILSYVVLTLTGGFFLLLNIDSHSKAGLTTRTADLFETPFLGGIQLVIAALWTAWNLRSRKENYSDHMEKTFLLAAILIWTFFVVAPLAGVATIKFSALANISGLADTSSWMAFLFALSTALLLAINHYKNWPGLLWLGQSVWLALAWFTAELLWYLGFKADMPMLESWLAYFILWFACEKFLHTLSLAGNQRDCSLSLTKLKWVHIVRIQGLWILLALGLNELTLNWLADHSSAEQKLLLEANWYIDKFWANYLAAWLYLLIFYYLMNRVHKAAWPVTPLQDWYRKALLPFFALLIFLFVGYWNFTRDGSMAPLPYIPVLNPLDITTLLVFLVFFMLHQSNTLYFSVIARKYFAGFSIFVWANLTLLRSAVHWLPVSYDFAAMMKSQTIQTMLSLFWTVSAMCVMYWAYKHMYRTVWLLGASLLAVVVVKLFLVDLSDVGGLARVISFIGVGLLMVLIGYIAPLPEQKAIEKNS